MILRVHEAQALEAVMTTTWSDPRLPGGHRDEAEEKVVDWLGRVRLLNGVPFEYLVPDEGLLEPGTIRFFHLDRNWTDALVDGAISAGAVTNRDRREVQVDHEDLRSRIDDAERAQWVDPPTSSAQPAPAAGFILRSRAVSGWPGLHVNAFRKSGSNLIKLKVLRIERLAPAILVALFDGIPQRVEIEEPRSGIQFGARSDRFPDEAANTWWLDVRDTATAVELDSGAKVQVPFRAGSAGVIHLTELAKRLTQVPGSGLEIPPNVRVPPPFIDSAELALQLIRYPYQQAFEGEGSSAPSSSTGRFIPGRYLEATEARAPWLETHTVENVETTTRTEALLETMRLFND